jgi:hypothetical protein
MPRLEDLTPAGLYALDLLRERKALSRSEATEAAGEHHISAGEALQGFQELQRHGIVREEAGRWTLTLYGGQFQDAPS